MPLRRRAWLTREGWYYLAVLAFIVGGAVLRSVNLLVVLAGMMIAPLLFNWRLVMASLTGLIVRRKLPEQILAGEPLTVEIDVENSRRWMSSWLLRSRIGWSESRGQGSGDRGTGTQVEQGWIGCVAGRSSGGRIAVHARRRVIPHVPARRQGVGTYRITLHRRGRYRFGPLRVSTRFPLGLVWGQITLPEQDELIVSPRLGRLLPAVGQPAGGRAGRRSAAASAARHVARATTTACGPGKAATACAGSTGGRPPSSAGRSCGNSSAAAAATWRSCSIRGSRRGSEQRRRAG